MEDKTLTFLRLVALLLASNWLIFNYSMRDILSVFRRETSDPLTFAISVSTEHRWATSEKSLIRPSPWANDNYTRKRGFPSQQGLNKGQHSTDVEEHMSFCFLSQSITVGLIDLFVCCACRVIRDPQVKHLGHFCFSQVMNACGFHRTRNCSIKRSSNAIHPLQFFILRSGMRERRLWSNPTRFSLVLLI